MDREAGGGQKLSEIMLARIAAEDGRHLILSTCYGSGKDGRLLIIAEE